MNGSNIETMFLSLIDQINALQQSKRKKIMEDDDGINPPLTTEQLKSERTDRNETQNEDNKE